MIPGLDLQAFTDSILHAVEAALLIAGIGLGLFLVLFRR